MGIFSPSGSSSTSTGGGTQYTNPVVDTVSLPIAFTEQSYTFPLGTKKFLVQLREVATLKVGYVSSGDTLTVGAGLTYEEQALAGTSALTLYFQSSRSATTLEILYWT